MQNIEASDAGTYYCIATNAANSTTKRFELEVTEQTTELNGVKWFRNKMESIQYLQKDFLGTTTTTTYKCGCYLFVCGCVCDLR